MIGWLQWQKATAEVTAQLMQLENRETKEAREEKARDKMCPSKAHLHNLLHWAPLLNNPQLCTYQRINPLMKLVPSSSWLGPPLNIATLKIQPLIHEPFRDFFIFFVFVSSL